MPGRHPDDDLLADLAADVLPAGQARAVEAHVLACHRCAGLLEDAERVRSLLLSGDPGPVPADVWHRIEAALAAEAAPAAPPAPDQPLTGSHAIDSARAGRVVPLPSSSGSSDDGGRGWADDSDPLDDPARWNGRPAAVLRSGSGGSRRDARDGGVRRRGSLLLAVAAVFAVVAVVGSVKLLGRGGSSEASMSAGTGGGSASAPADSGTGAARPVIVESGRNYRASTLAAEASSLLAATTASGGVTSNSRSGAEPASPSAAARLGRLPAAVVRPDPAATDITNPARLAACLQALGVGQERLVAVDLATYEGREAAILLLTTTEGSGHEVWAVERSCAPGAEGALNYTRLKD